MSEEIEDLASRIREVRSGARRGNTIVELMEIAGFEPVSAFRGGDWRGCDFSTCDLRGFDLRDARFFQANFEKARVEEADFRGANLHQTTLHLASDWRRAILSPEQRRAVMLHADRCGYALTARDREELGTANGSGVSIRQYNERIRDAESYKEALEIFDDLAKAGVAPDKYTFTLLIGAAPSEGLAKGHFQDMLDHQVAPDRVALRLQTRTALPPECLDFQDARHRTRTGDKDHGLAHARSQQPVRRTRGLQPLRHRRAAA